MWDGVLPKYPYKGTGIKSTQVSLVQGEIVNYQKIFRLSSVFLIALVVCCLFSVKVSARDLSIPSCDQTPAAAKIVSIIQDSSTQAPSAVQLRCRTDGTLSERSIQITTPELKQDATKLHPGDVVVLESEAPKHLFIKTVNSSPLERILIGGLIGSLLWLVFSLLLNWKNPLQLTLGLDNRYSNSKTQLFFWFFALLTAYITVNCLPGLKGGIGFFGGVGIPPNLLLLSGLSAFSFSAAKGITQSKVNSEEVKKEAGATEARATETEATKTGKLNGNARFPFDLFHNDEGRTDLGDFQMIIVTAIAIVVYSIQVYGFLSTIEFRQLVSLPDIDSSLLASFGLGQGAYLAKKLVGNLGES
ncbi:hypothetical protein [Leptodesmis sichuanensis]|uniref:hypothetical protein n=1 Tax=Leptodesmis sichuanensis TaxID=2906798 RepID=UPI001F372575|nr:hypothetical protein [Leptodesmis sichuanensis]UIE37032.1 hypothetical protein KIK02_18890 [Leptodesmis sichuanensis A121]